MLEIIIPLGILAVMGLILGIGIGAVAKKFAVKQDERIPKVRECLPGANCGGCGFAGCDAYAKAIVEQNAQITLCAVGGEKAAKAIADTMGMAPAIMEKEVAYVQCSGDCHHAYQTSRYDGVVHCLEASMIPGGGPKGCTYGCLGFGTCESVCQFGAIHVVDGLARVDEERCVGCGKCVSVCPKNIIRLVAKKQRVRVQCSGQDRGRDVRIVCEAGCLGCSLCVRTCESGAIAMAGNVARIDSTKCTQCGKCAEKCPAKVIRILQ